MLYIGRGSLSNTEDAAMFHHTPLGGPKQRGRTGRCRENRQQETPASCTPHARGLRGLYKAEIPPGSLTCCVLAHVVGTNLQFNLSPSASYSICLLMRVSCLSLSLSLCTYLSVTLLVFKGPEFI